jgi:Peptidase family M28
MDPRSRYEQRVRDLAGFGHRGSATKRERQAATYLRGEIRSLGLEAQEERFPGSASLGARLLLHVALAAGGAALLWRAPLAAAALGAAALLSLVMEQTAQRGLLSRCLPSAPSQNVVARLSGTPSPRRRLVLCAHYDTQRTGLIWHEGGRRLTAILRRIPPLLQMPFLLPSLAMAVQPCLAVAAALGVAPVLVSWLTGGLLVVYGVTGALMADWVRGAAVPGASDNASGAAAALELAERWLADPVEDVELVLLLTGCEETGLLGAAAWADAHHDEIRAVPTLFLNLDGLGFGPPRFLGAEVPVAGLPISYPAALVDQCRRIVDARPLAVFGPTDGLAFLVRGIPGITLIGCQDGGHLPHYHQLTDTPDRVDFDAAWRGIEYAAALLRGMAEAT